VRILKILSKIGELKISEIARRTNLNYTTANQHLQLLEDSEIVRHKTFGRIRIYRFNEENPRARLIRKFVEAWKELG
jgi:predicted transcriptional regulator